MNEIEKINNTIDAFTDNIKERMLQKYKEGYRGWDGKYSEIYLSNELLNDAVDVARNLPIKNFKPTCTVILNQRLVDISARCMMLWYRYNKPPDADRVKAGSGS